MITISREALYRLVDGLPESEWPTAARVLEALRHAPRDLPAVLRDAPLDDEPETAEERAAVCEALEELDRDERYTLDEVKRELGL